MESNRELIFWLTSAVLLALGLWLLHGILLPFIAGMAIAYFLDPITDRLEDWGLSRHMAVGLITLLIVLITTGVIIALIPLLIHQGLDLVAKIPDYIDTVRDGWQNLAGDHLSGLPALDINSLQATLESALAPTGKLVKQVLDQSMAFIGLLSLVVVTPIVAVYLLLDWDRMVARVDELLPRRHAPRVRAIFREIDQTIAGFVRGQSMVCLSLGTFYAVGLSLAGLQFGVLIGFAAGLVSFIPYLGAILGGAAAGLLALFQFWPDWGAIAMVLLVFALGQFLEGNFLTPKLIGDRIKLHPVWVMFALFAFGYLFGFVGMLVAVPVAATLGVLVRHAAVYYQHSRLYRDDASDSVEED